MKTMTEILSKEELIELRAQKIKELNEIGNKIQELTISPAYPYCGLCDGGRCLVCGIYHEC